MPAPHPRNTPGGDAPDRYAPDDHLGGRSLLVAAAYVVLRRLGPDGDEVLLQRREGTGYMDGRWAVLAGHVDPGESVHEAAVREALEESGVRVDAAALRPVTALHRFERRGPAVEQRLDAFFEVTAWDGEPALREADKASAMGWFPLRRLPEPVVPHERMVLDLLATGERVAAVISLPS